MSRSLRNTRTPTFRFNRNDDDILEIYESDSIDEHSVTSHDVSNAPSINSDHSMVGLSAAPKTERTEKVSERPSVKEFLAAKLNKAKSLDNDEGSKIDLNATSKWFHEIKGKIKEKFEEKKKDNHKDGISNDEIKRIAESDGSRDKNGDGSRDKNADGSRDKNADGSRDKNADESIRIIENKYHKYDYVEKTSSVDIMESNSDSTAYTVMSAHIYSHDADLEEFEVIGDDKSSFGSCRDDIVSYDDPPIEIDDPIDETSQQWDFNKLLYTCSFGVAIVSLIIALLSPLPSFVNGLLYGVFLTILILCVFTYFISSNFFIKKVPQKNRPKVKPLLSKKSDDSIYKGWMFEFIGDYENRDSGFKTETIFARLQGSNLRLSKPKQNIKKAKLDSNVLPAFISQRFYDLSKMSHKRVSLLLPKSVRNRKKYVWSKRYPLCLELEDFKTNAPIKLVLFIHNCRDKEEWFWKLRDVTVKRSPTDDKDSAVSDPPTPLTSGDVLSQEIEHLPRTQSLDLSISSYQSATFTSSSASVSPSTPTKELHISAHSINYTEFIETALNFKPKQTSTLAWFNAFIGRVCYDVLNEPFWSKWFAAKFQRKLRKLRLPYFMESLTISEIDLGTNVPKFNHIHTPPMVDSRGLWIEFDISYSGGFTMTLETKLNLMKLKVNEQDQGTVNDEVKRDFTHHDPDISDNESDSILSSSEEETDEQILDPDNADATKKQQKILKFVDKITSSQYFQKATENKYIKRAMEGVSNCPLILTVQIQTLNGNLVFNIPPPPTDRLWYGFRGKPELVLSARPKLGLHEVSIHHVTDLIERQLRAEFAKVLVLPNMDDLIIPTMMTNSEQFVHVVP